jgi:tetratricopeptide (TPR) repeat protein
MRLFPVSIALLLLIATIGEAAAQADAARIPLGDDVLVLADVLDIHAQPDGYSIRVGQLIRGVKSELHGYQTDVSGAEWVYLGDEAYGWVLAARDGVPTVTAYTEEIAQEIVAAADAATPTVTELAAAGAVLNGQDRFAESETAYTRALTLEPENTLVLEARGRMFIDAGDFGRAIDDLTFALTLGRMLPGTINSLGVAHARYEDSLGAFGRYTQANAVADGQFGLVLSNLGVYYKRRGLLEEAEQHYRDALAVDPFLFLAYSNLANLVFDVYNDSEQALSLYNRALELAPRAGYIYIARGAFYAETGSYDLSLQDQNTGLELDPTNVNGFSDRAVTWMRRGEWELAEQDFKRALELDPYNQNAYYNMATMNAYRGHYQEARSSYTAAVMYGSRYTTSVPLYRSQVSIALGDIDGALEDITSHIDYRRGQKTEFDVLAYLIRAAIYLHRGEIDNALDDYRSAFRIYPMFAFYFGQIGGGYRVTPQRLMDEEQRMREAIAATPEDFAPYLSLAILYMEYGDWENALTNFRDAGTHGADPQWMTFVTDFEALLQQ